MKLHVMLVLGGLLAAQAVNAETFNVNYDFTRTPQISGPGGTLPPPPGLPTVSTLDPSPGNSVHSSGGFGPLWIDSYQSGDYFSFDVTDSNPANKLVFDGIWFGVQRGATQGPDRFVVEMWSAGTLVNSMQTTSPGVYVWDLGWTSINQATEIRIVGLDGVNDVGPGPFDSYGVDFISASFTVIPEPSTLALTLGGLIVVATALRSSRRIRVH